MYIAKVGEDETVQCASCESKWKVSYLVQDLGRQRLRANGFAFIWFDDGAICINYCPHCDSRPAVPFEVPQWTSLSPLF